MNKHNMTQNDLNEMKELQENCNNKDSNCNECLNKCDYYEESIKQFK